MAVAAPERIQFHLSNVRFNGLRSPESVVFFGDRVTAACERCGAYDQTLIGHKFCAHVACPIALIESKRRRRKRTSSLERTYIPRLARADASGSPDMTGR